MANRKTAAADREFKKTFDGLFQPATAALADIVGGELNSQRYYALVAVIHDLAFVAARARTGAGRGSA